VTEISYRGVHETWGNNLQILEKKVQRKGLPGTWVSSLIRHGFLEEYELVTGKKREKGKFKGRRIVQNHFDVKRGVQKPWEEVGGAPPAGGGGEGVIKGHSVQKGGTGGKKKKKITSIKGLTALLFNG